MFPWNAHCALGGFCHSCQPCISTFIRRSLTVHQTLSSFQTLLSLLRSPPVFLLLFSLAVPFSQAVIAALCVTSRAPSPTGWAAWDAALVVLSSCFILPSVIGLSFAVILSCLTFFPALHAVLLLRCPSFLCYLFLSWRLGLIFSLVPMLVRCLWFSL